MVVTSRGGVGCCWVQSLVRLTDYDFALFGAASVSYLSSRGIRLNQPHMQEISQGASHVNNEIFPLSNLFKNVPFLTSLEMSPFCFSGIGLLVLCSVSGCGRSGTLRRGLCGAFRV